MLQKILWNDIARNGVVIGLIMSLFRVMDIIALMSAGDNFALITSLIGVGSFLLYVYLVRYAVLKFVEKLPKEMAFSYMQSLSFISLTSILASVWVAITSTVMVSQVVGFEAYITSYIEAVRGMIEATVADNSFASDMGQATIEAAENSPEPNIVDSLFGTAFTYIIRALVVGIPLSFWTRRKGEVVDSKRS